jgi:hypothetical protein
MASTPEELNIPELGRILMRRDNVRVDLGAIEIRQVAILGTLKKKQFGRKSLISITNTQNCVRYF